MRSHVPMKLLVRELKANQPPNDASACRSSTAFIWIWDETGSRYEKGSRFD